MWFNILIILWLLFLTVMLGAALLRQIMIERDFLDLTKMRWDTINSSTSNTPGPTIEGHSSPPSTVDGQHMSSRPQPSWPSTEEVLRSPPGTWLKPTPSSPQPETTETGSSVKPGIKPSNPSKLLREFLSDKGHK